MPIFMSTLFILICVLMIGIILLQKGRGGGLAGAFGGAGGHSAFGSRTGDMFTWITVILVALFFGVGAVAARTFRPLSDVAEQSAGETEAELDATETDEQPADQQPADEQPADEQPADGETEVETPAATPAPEADDAAPAPQPATPKAPADLTEDDRVE